MLLRNGWDYRECRCENNGDWCDYCFDYHFGQNAMKTDFENGSLEPSDLIAYRQFVSNAYDHEWGWIELNRESWDFNEVGAALATLMELSKAEKNTHEVWMQLAWERRNQRHALRQ